MQVLIDGVDAYTAGIARSYIVQTLHDFTPVKAARDRQYESPAHSDDDTSGMQPGEDLPKSGLLNITTTILYNPELRSSWYFIPGILSGLITLIGILVSSAALLREKESGTLEQLLMTPYSAGEVLAAKIIPLFIVLAADVVIAVLISMIAFELPVRGSLSLLLVSSILYIGVAVGFGMMLATVCRAQRQAQLASYFILIPMVLLSGSLVPADTMPESLQMLAAFNPLLYYTQILRGVFLKGAGWNIHYTGAVILAAFVTVQWAFCLARFRRQEA